MLSSCFPSKTVFLTNSDFVYYLQAIVYADTVLWCLWCCPRAMIYFALLRSVTWSILATLSKKQSKIPRIVVKLIPSTSPAAPPTSDKNCSRANIKVWKYLSQKLNYGSQPFRCGWFHFDPEWRQLRPTLNWSHSWTVSKLFQHFCSF